jgi:hypothetical protein
MTVSSGGGVQGQKKSCQVYALARIATQEIQGLKTSALQELEKYLTLMPSTLQEMAVGMQAAGVVGSLCLSFYCACDCPDRRV